MTNTTRNDIHACLALLGFLFAVFAMGCGAPSDSVRGQVCVRTRADQSMREECALRCLAPDGYAPPLDGLEERCALACGEILERVMCTEFAAETL